VEGGPSREFSADVSIGTRLLRRVVKPGRESPHCPRFQPHRAPGEFLMQSVRPASSSSSASLWTARILAGLGVLFMIFDGAIKLAGIEPVRDAFNQLGWPFELAAVIGAIDLVCVTLYLIPRTSVLGAVLLTGYLGGAVATHLRVGREVFPLVFPAIVAAMFWIPLYLRDPRVRALLPIRR
jgi:hypothetical protein